MHGQTVTSLGKPACVTAATFIGIGSYSGLLLLLFCVCRCLAAEPESQVPLQRNPADDGTAQQNRDGNRGHQVVLPPQTQPSPQDQQQQKHPQASDGKARDVGHSAAADSQSQTPVVPDGSHGDTAKEVEAGGSFQDVGNIGQSAGADSVLVSNILLLIIISFLICQIPLSLFQSMTIHM